MEVDRCPALISIFCIQDLMEDDSTKGTEGEKHASQKVAGGYAVAVAAPSPPRRRPSSGPGWRSGGYVVAVAARSSPRRRPSPPPRCTPPLQSNRSNRIVPIQSIAIQSIAIQSSAIQSIAIQSIAIQSISIQSITIHGNAQILLS